MSTENTTTAATAATTPAAASASGEVAQKQYTTLSAPEGYWIDARGVMTPADMVKPIDKDRDALVGEIIERALPLHKGLTEFKQSVFADTQAFRELSGELYGAKVGGEKGNMTFYSWDGVWKVTVAIAERLAFDERLQAAKALIDECLKEWTKDSQPEVISLIDEAFQVDKEGEVSTSRILRLRRLDIADERWLNAMRAINDAILIVGSKKYVRIYKRSGDSNQYVPFSLDLAAV
ncbi:DUF3164 family protein [Salmonella enterica]|uniref:Sulfate transporter n=1 Tax=Salmonella enterica I TaxID=59201 RepID=A0A3R0XTS4_SALET|nr:DUF3164 family protein [Salmonella enterica subsp. enterica serovar Oranienburg]EHC9335936.1 DUF3164 family protein [Salmonella enterica]EED9397166.1 DUF3164 family protein [Salmonella enterica subsp. enterica serovar Oranienburg]EEE0365926.1 DUF3164 family protein [Salmonella enterica subsp. enterica serovar Oranienburg]EIG8968390.1 DUF3164 family protein [Salmonella enterica]